jgi:hypothetical protein
MSILQFSASLFFHQAYVPAVKRLISFSYYYVNGQREDITSTARDEEKI